MRSGEICEIIRNWMTMEEKPKFGAKTINFIREVQAETKKVTWPTRSELYGATSVVIAVTILLCTMLGITDSLLGQIMQVVVRL